MRQPKHKAATSSLFAALGLAGLMAAPPAGAQTAAPSDAPQASDEIETVVVTAQRREEKSRDVPISITALSPDQLATANVNSLSDTAKVTPGLRFDTQGPAMQPTIRGVGTAITTSGGGPNVGIYVDGFFQPNTYVSDFQLMKLSGIQVLKGPQGTLFGRNTTGGAILVTSLDPSRDTSGEVKVGYGRFNTPMVQAYGTTGLGSNMAVDIEGIYRRSDSYFTDIGTGNDSIGKTDDWSVRTGFKLQLSDSLSVLLRYTHSSVSDPTTQLVNAYVDKSGQAGFFDKVSSGGQEFYGKSSSTGLPLVFMAPVNPDDPESAYSAVPGTYTSTPGKVLLNEPVSFKAKSDSIQATVKYDLGLANLTSYTQYRHDRSPYHADLDVTAAPLFTLLVDVWDSTFSQEFLLNSKSDSRLQWTAGVNYFQNVDNWSDIQAAGLIPSFGFDPNTNDLAPFGGSSTTTKSAAGFADLTYALMPDKLFLTLGGRYSHDIVDHAYFKTNQFTQFTGYTGPDGQTLGVGTPAGVVIPVADLTHNSFTPRAVVRYKPNELSSVYASYAKGYKAGILNVGGSSQQTVAPEKNNAFEIGYKFEKRRFAVDLASFLYDYKDLQVSSFQAGAAKITNAASARIYGAEGQVRYNLLNNLDLNLGAIWTHARYRSFANAPYYTYCDPAATYPAATYCASGPGTITETTTDASGYHMQRSPDVTLTFGASYLIPTDGRGDFTLSGNLYYTSSFYFDPEQQFKQDGYPLLSLRTQWVDPSKRFTVAVFGDNVTDKRYQTQVLFNTVGIGSVWSSPATYGLSLGMKF